MAGRLLLWTLAGSTVYLSARSSVWTINNKDSVKTVHHLTDIGKGEIDYTSTATLPVVCKCV